jgi:hypothetical protein
LRCNDFRRALTAAEDCLESVPKTTPFSELEQRLGDLGFEKGWGATAERIREGMHLLQDLIQVTAGFRGVNVVRLPGSSATLIWWYYARVQVAFCFLRVESYSLIGGLRSEVQPQAMAQVGIHPGALETL